MMRKITSDYKIVDGKKYVWKKVKVPIAFFDGKGRRREIREIYRYCEESPEDGDIEN